MGKIYIKIWEPPYDSGIVGGVWVPIRREYYPNDEGVLNLSNCNKIKFLCYPYAGTNLKMYMEVEPWIGEYYEENGKLYYESDQEKTHSSYPPPTEIEVTNEWETIEIDWDFGAIPVEVRNELVWFALYFYGNSIGIKLKSLWAETIEREQDYAFIM